jgi:hypothetical protein
MKLAGDIAVEARHQHIRQIIDALLRDNKQNAGRGESGFTVQPGVHVRTARAVALRAPPCASA